MLWRGNVLAFLFAAAMSGATAPLLAQDQSVEDRLVEVFRTHCIATLGRSALIRPELRKLGWMEHPGSTDHFADDRGIVEQRYWTEPSPRTLRRLYVEVVEGANYPTRTCRVGMPFADKAALSAALAQRLALRESTLVASDTRLDTEVTRWTMHVGGLDATVELGIPSYRHAPGYSLTLVVQRQ